ncbi:MAG: universal stress protein [Anaerolineales bacterium]|jgi:nucleotide-binding universal stress UspA family protein
MFKHILVPLDGSKLAEAALPAAASLAQIFNAPVTLLHIIEQDAPEEIHRDHHLTEASEAKVYLAGIAKRAFPDKIKVDLHVHTSPVADVARSIVDHSSDEIQPDLIILSSHGNSGMHDLFFGNIAQEVAAASGTPVLLIKPDGAATTFQLQHILVPLDNESVHDKALPIAESLAKAYQAELNLLCVIPTLGTLSGEQAAVSNMLPATATAYLDISEDIAQEHFQAHLDAFEKVHIRATAEIARGDPAPVIAKTAEKIDANLILFGTHGRAGLDAFWNRSVAASVARRTKIPILLIPLSE